MVSSAFDYVRADSYLTAVQLLVEHGEDAKILAGGQSLGPMLNLRLARPELLIDINDIPTPEPSVASGLLHLPALTRHRTLLEHPLVTAHAPLLAEAARHVGNVRVRNRGTLGGSFAHCDPTAELATAALALDAQVNVLGPAGLRTIPARELFVTYLTTALEPTEVITEVVIPVARPGQGWSFQEMVRRTSDFAIVAVAARMDLNPAQGSVVGTRVALAGVADTVILAADDLLSGLTAGRDDDDTPEQVAALIAASLNPSDDVHATGAYRRRLAAVLTARALRQAHHRAKGAVQ
jgi:aerobic carbon-monoxide dehydrogenase medium subunit